MSSQLGSKVVEAILLVSYSQVIQELKKKNLEDADIGFQEEVAEIYKTEHFTGENTKENTNKFCRGIPLTFLLNIQRFFGKGTKKHNKYAQYKIELDFIKVKKFSSPKDT